MRPGWFIIFALFAGVSHATTDDFIDRVDQALTLSDAGGDLRGRLSGTVEIEGYSFNQPAPGLIYTDDERLLNPRLVLFLDAQLGPRLYLFAQARVDRGFDPGDHEVWRLRLDEAAARWSLSGDERLQIQAGKFATVVGNWVARHGAWENPFVTAPLPYENLAGVWDGEAAGSVDTLLRWAHLRPGPLRDGEPADKDRRLPVLWGPVYTSGVALAGKSGKFEYAAEVKNAALASRPESWGGNRADWSHPAVNGRVGYRPDEGWNIGVSAGTGTYLRPAAQTTLPPGRGRGGGRQVVLGQDVAFAWRHLQVWTEVYAARFEIPRVGNADTLAYYAEVKYKFAPRFFAALRWNQQFFGTLRDDAGRDERWGKNVWRLDLAPTFRPTLHTQLKLQYSLQRTGRPSAVWNHLYAAQFTLRF